MKIVIIAQEEAVYFSPFLRRVIAARPRDVSAVVIAGSRGAGNHPKTLRQNLRDLYTLWLMLEPY
ncbi:MAG: hypothetical protein NC924_10260, partial [Candidatus Omnitrophica bacterium]|nr:hypothetical protein [Candidatus Omnitrophota bacterium]